MASQVASHVASQVVNNKTCAQCEISFKGKSSKCLNCSICNFWFCLECSHVSNKVYDVLKSEPNVKNLPFNCDGCTRVLPKITELAKALHLQQLKIESCEKKYEDLKNTLQSVVEEQVEKAITEYREREERKLNIIIHNVPEPRAESTDKKGDDEISLKEILLTTKCVGLKNFDFVRLGRPSDGRDRLIKVTLGSVSDKHRVLGGTRYLRAKIGQVYAHRWSKIFITPDQTKEERIKNMNLKRELEKRKLEEKNHDLIIFRGEIVERRSDSLVNSTMATPGISEPGRPFRL